MSTMIIDLTVADVELIEQIAAFLVDCFREFAPTWLPDVDAARNKVLESLVAERRSRVLIDNERYALSWIGAIPGDAVWKIHPIAVAPAAQGKGYATLLVNNIIELARAAGAVAVWAGTSADCLM